ncbi:MAG: Do family serine endopeptidase [Gammaproteobacteria bacterium]|nr:Do family serine endopeptidase [Gammaproteobacteria bacterium]MBU6508857.1 Do family serine endopeptidase [Gammaproteobacteria bacterium]MDE1983480.1 Do family serine endopeptidase [Gammaproteobacteria bacterium]MDE2108164.1 Do family serine endopeptidase [Gammaproteobacteria bacterium]MDE2460195.1 Do family serine endopeptidase [Gammaproteobacteria bacterium]
MRRVAWLISCVLLAAVIPLQEVLAGDLPDFTAVVNKVSAAVVNVSAIQPADTLAGNAASGSAASGSGDSYPDWYRRYFGAAPPDNGATGDDSDSDPATTESLGSGFIISTDGEILTNYHVVEHAESIRVKLNDRRVLPARIIGVDPQSDLALLKIHAEHLTAVSVNTRPVHAGQWVLAIGSPFGFDYSVTAGIVSAEGRSISGEQYVPYIQTDVPINPGNSGGPLFNLQGQVVGINAEIYSGTGGYQGVSFAIPMNLAMDVVRQLRAHGHVTRGWLGISIGDVDTKLAQTLHLPRPEGALVRQVAPASPAARAGIKAGDVILSYDGMEVVSSQNLPPLVGGTAVGHDVPVTVLRRDHLDRLNVRVGELPVGAPAAPETVPATAGGLDELGLVTRALTKNERKQLNINQGGVLVEQIGRGVAQRAGVKPGDVLLMLYGVAVTGPQQLQHLEKQLPDRAVPLLIKRPDATLFLALQAGGA